MEKHQHWQLSFSFFFTKKVNEGSDNSEIWCVEQLSIAEKKRYRIAFLSEQPFMEQISSQYYIVWPGKLLQCTTNLGVLHQEYHFHRLDKNFRFLF